MGLSTHCNYDQHKLCRIGIWISDHRLGSRDFYPLAFSCWSALKNIYIQFFEIVSHRNCLIRKFCTALHCKCALLVRTMLSGLRLYMFLLDSHKSQVKLWKSVQSACIWKNSITWGLWLTRSTSQVHLKISCAECRRQILKICLKTGIDEHCLF